MLFPEPGVSFFFSRQSPRPHQILLSLVSSRAGLAGRGPGNITVLPSLGWADLSLPHTRDPGHSSQ